MVNQEFDVMRYLTDSDDKSTSSTDDDGDVPNVPTGYYEIVLPSGASFGVLTEQEAQQVQDKVEEYRRQYALDNVADLGSLDVIIQMEAMHFRLSQWFMRRCDYNGGKVDENQLAQRSREISAELRQRQKLMGIDKVARDRARGEGSVHERMANLLARAERFGIHRNNQSARAIELAMEAISLRRAARNLPQNEEGDKLRKKLAITDSDIMEWFDTIFEPEFMQIDIDYRNSDQRTWIREMSTY